MTIFSVSQTMPGSMTDSGASIDLGSSTGAVGGLTPPLGEAATDVGGASGAVGGASDTMGVASGAMGGCLSDDEDGGDMCGPYSALSSDQSTSEDSSLTSDSDRLDILQILFKLLFFVGNYTD